MTIHYILTVLLPVLVAALTIFVIWRKNIKDHYPGLFSAFGLGMVSILIVLLFQYIAMMFGIDPYANIRRNIFYSFVVMGVGSELGKFLILRYHSFPRKTFLGPIDSIVYSIVISMGFTLMGTIIYLTFPVYTEIDFLYAYTVVIANVFFAVIMGFFVGLGKTRETRFVDSMTGLFAASFFHALYNFCFITEDYRLLIFFALGAFVVVIMLYFKAFQINEEYKRSRND